LRPRPQAVIKFTGKLGWFIACGYHPRAHDSVKLRVDTQRRKAMRFPLEVSVSFWWTDANGVHQLGEGRSYDVSELGVFVCASSCPPAGAQVGLKIPIAEVPDVPRALRMEVEGRVLRVEQVRNGEGRDGFVILSDRAILLENDKSNE
jgi:hypothetical protein